LATVRVTGILTELLLAPRDPIEIVPVYVPGARLPGSTETLRLAGVVPPALLIDNHPPPKAVDTAAVKLVFPADTESV
jgi:hypothetical protein